MFKDQVFWISSGMILLANVFMSYAWYGHLKSLADKPWWVAALVSWAIALLEYLILIPAIRMASAHYSVMHLRILQEVISLSVFVPFAIYAMGQSFKVDYIWAALCLLGAVYFIFRNP